MSCCLKAALVLVLVFGSLSMARADFRDDLRDVLASKLGIRLNLDADRAVKAKGVVGTGNMPLHPVRAHLRLLHTGQVVIVRARMRGNPERGVRSHHYTVVRAEDQA